MSQVPASQASFRRMGFTDDEIGALADRLVDAPAAWGDPESIAARGSEPRRARADHVAVSLVSDAPLAELLDQWRQLAATLIPG